MFIMIQRPLWTIPVSNALICKLRDAGFDYVEDLFCDARKEELEELIGSKLNISELIKTAESKTALDVYKEEINENSNIVTFSKAIDDLFGGGIPTGRITEIVGAPGTGKTQICLQLCISVQIPEFLGGISSSAAYVETNNNFSFKRIKEIHDSCSRHCTKCSSERRITLQENDEVKKFANVNSLNNVVKFSVETVEELRASIFSFENLLEKSNKKIRLLIIDSFTFQFYSTEADLKRTKMISEILKQLNRIASTHHVAVVITNELTTCILENGATEIIPSLGETFAHAVHNRILVGRDSNSENHYTALVCKSSEFPSESAYFQITDGGIRDIPSN